MGDRVAAGLIAGLIAVSLASCGGGDPAPLTKVEFLRQGNEACEQASEERGAATKQAIKDGSEGSGGSSTELEFEEFVTDALLPPMQEMTDELDDLGAPKGDEKQVEAIVAAFQKEIDRIEADPSSATPSSFSAPSRLAAGYGLTACVI